MIDTYEETTVPGCTWLHIFNARGLDFATVINVPIGVYI